MPDPVAVNEMFGRIAGRYDVANRLLSGGLDVLWRKRLVREVACTNPGIIVDLATGSGDVAFALRHGVDPAVSITGMDFCQPMLDEADRKKVLIRDDPRIDFKIGDAMNIPLPDRSTDAVTIAFGLRNTVDRVGALCEMRRILTRPRGHLFVLEFSQPYHWFSPVYFFYLKFILPRIAALVTGDKSAYDYLCGSIESYPDREKICEEIREAGFTEVRAVALTLGTVALHVARA